MKKHTKIIYGLGCILALSTTMPVFASADADDNVLTAETTDIYNENATQDDEIQSKKQYLEESLNVNRPLASGGWKLIGEKPVYFDSESRLVNSEYNGWLNMFDNKYWFENGILQLGWQKIENSRYYFDLNTGALKTGWLTIEGDVFYTNSSGVMQTGWQKLDGKNYYFDSNGVLQVGFYTVGGSCYYSDASGVMQIGWKTIEESTYYFDSSGKMKRGWTQIDGNSYYFNTNGKMQTGWICLSGKWYYLKEENGAMATGWLKTGGETYYLTSSGVRVSGIQFIDNQAYKFDENGKMLHSCQCVIGGKTYTIGANGVIQNYMTEATRKAKTVLDRVGWNLKSAFNWSAGIPYYKNVGTVTSGMTHSEYYALYGFNHSTGDCHVMAATFYKMALLLGYEAYYVEGYVPLARGGMGPHAWCEIVINGTTYVCDPDFTNETGRNGYLITYGTSGTWRYSNYGHVN